VGWSSVRHHEPANWRAVQGFDSWLRKNNLIGLAGIDTRALTRRIRDKGPPNGAIIHAPDGKIDIDALLAQAQTWPGLEGMDLALEVSSRQTYSWDETRWSLDGGYGKLDTPKRHVVAVDYGAKHNILRSLAANGCRVTVVPAMPPPRKSCAISRTASSCRTARRSGRDRRICVPC